MESSKIRKGIQDSDEGQCTVSRHETKGYWCDYRLMELEDNMKQGKGLETFRIGTFLTSRYCYPCSN